MSNLDEDFISEFLRGVSLRAAERRRSPAFPLFSGLLRFARNDWLLLSIRNAHAGADIALNPIRRDRVTKTVFRKRLHSRDRLGEIRRLERHQHLLIGH